VKLLLLASYLNFHGKGDTKALFGSEERVWMEKSKERKIIENPSFHCLDALLVRKENIFWEGPM